MRVVGYLFVLIFICMGTAMASAVPDSITVSSSEPSLIAIGGQSTTITAYIFNQSNPGDLYLGEVRFSLQTPGMGTLSQLNVTTDASGYASTEFTASNISGNAIIKAAVTEYPSLYNTQVLPVYGPKPDVTSTLTTSSEWIVASGLDHSTITMYARNQSVPIQGLKVIFRANDTSLGKFNPSVAYTDADGKASTTYMAMQKSGTAKINATVEYNIWDSPASGVFEVLQKIDHDTPYRIANYTVTSDVGVGNTTDITALIVDRWNNPVDNKRLPEDFSFLVSSPTTLYSPPNSVPAYWTSTVNSNTITAQTDIDGNVSASLTMDTRPGVNVVLLHPIGIPVHDKYFFINGVANGQPWYLEQAFEPPRIGAQNPWVFADGDKLFNITYTIKDRYGNGLPNRNITWWTNLPDEQATIATNISGMARRSYGPKTSIGFITITAQAEDNLALIVQETVEFSNMDPVDMRLTATPQSMPSRDVKSDGFAEIVAKVMDIKGNPVEGETVTFTINHPESYPLSQVTIPSFSQIESVDSTSAVTDQNGNAIVQFWPGGFIPEWQDPNWDQQATATCDVTATWMTITDNVDLAWKNYPYLSVYTSVTPKVVNVSDTVDVNIRLVGDGWALQPNPIDVILTTDRSGSMLKDYPDRMVSVRDAAKTFTDSLSPRDQIGLVSFGHSGTTDIMGYSYHYWLGQDSTHDDDTGYKNTYYSADPKYYSGYATVDLELSPDSSQIDDTIDTMIPYMGTPMRDAIKKSIDEIITRGQPEAVKAVIVLSDGDYNWYGDPLARGTRRTTWNPTDFTDLTTNYYSYSDLDLPNQNMAVYAQNHGIKIYSIAFATDISSGGRETLQILAESTGGKYYTASATNIADVYTAIAGELKQEAGVNTLMNLNYENIEVNSAPVPGDTVLSYVPIGPLKSTKIDSHWLNGSRVGLPGYPYNISQLNDWTPENQYILRFNVGTIRLNQVWEADYTLRVLRDGNINLFSPASIITFNDGINSLSLPKTFVTVIPNMMNQSIQNITLDIGDVTHDNTTGNQGSPILGWNWTRTYTGNRDVTEKYFVSIDGGQQWVQVGSRIIPAIIANIENSGRFQVDMRIIPGGIEAMNNNVTVAFRIEAYASDAGEPVTEEDEVAPPPPGSGFYLKLE